MAEGEALRNKQTWLRQERERLLAENGPLRTAQEAARADSQSQLTAMETRLAGLQAEADSARDAAAAEIQRLIDVGTAHTATTAAEIANLTQQLETALAEGEALRNKQTWLRQERERLLAENDALRTAQEAALADSQSQLTVMETRLAGFQAEADSARDAAAAEIQRLTDVGTAHTATTAAEIANLTQQLETALAEGEALRTAQEAALADSQSQLAAMETRLAGLQAEADSARDGAAAEIQRLTDAGTAQDEALLALTAKLETQTLDLQALRDNMDRQIRALVAEREATDTDLGALRHENSALVAQLAAALANASQYQQSLERGQAEAAAQLAQSQQAVQKLQSELQAVRQDAQDRLHDQQTTAGSMADQLTAAQDQAAANLAVLTAGFETRQIAADAQRDDMLRELRQLREALAQTQHVAESDKAAHTVRQTAQEKAFAQTRVMLEDDIENLQALLRDQLNQAERLRATTEQDKAAQTALRAERDAARAQAKALDEAIGQVLNSTAWKLTAPIRKVLETVRGQ